MILFFDGINEIKCICTLKSRHHVPHQKWKMMDVLDGSSEVMLVFIQHRKSLLSTVKHSWKSPVWPYICLSIFITAVLPCSLLVLQFCCFTKPLLIWQSAFVPHFHGSQSGRTVCFRSGRGSSCVRCPSGTSESVVYWCVIVVIWMVR